MAMEGICSIRDSQATAEMTLFASLLFCLLGSLLSSSWAEAPQAKVQARSRCPSGAFSLKEGVAWFCYEFHEYPLPFVDAEVREGGGPEAKKILGRLSGESEWGHLASITSTEQTEMIGGYVSRVNQERTHVWIGLHRRQNSDLTRGWRWTNGAYFGYTNWLPGEPNNLGGSELCVHIITESGYKGWNDTPCSYERPFLCKWRGPVV
ncbi:lithostathine-like [Heteronotia binoei]|uniref:lithostathine-like n=1 Tax=Heteronotia binoei TaxID=13085 RepID=UPI00292E64DF|nr:lithostathine-like [Heteronotia binoei]